MLGLEAEGGLMKTAETLVHLAGAFDDGEQSCVICQREITRSGFRPFEEGAYVLISGGHPAATLSVDVTETRDEYEHRNCTPLDSTQSSENTEDDEGD